MKRTGRSRRLKEPVLEAQNLTEPEVRLLIATYYAAQKRRKGGDSQLRSQGDKDDHMSMLENFTNKFAELEDDIQKALIAYAESKKLGRWMMLQDGIGGVIAAGLLAFLDVTDRPVVSHFWRICGLDPTIKWEKGQKRPWNPHLKVICWHLGQCFVKNGNEQYGELYRSQKQYVEMKNEEGANAERAKTFHTNSNYIKTFLKKGKLPPSNLDAQARRYAVKIFLSHLHAVMYWDKHGVAPAKPFALVHLRHAHLIKVPNTDMFPGFDEAYNRTP